MGLHRLVSPWVHWDAADRLSSVCYSVYSVTVFSQYFRSNVQLNCFKSCCMGPYMYMFLFCGFSK